MKTESRLSPTTPHPSPLKTIHVFDFDGTLTTCDTLLRFITFACGRRAFWWGMLLHAPLLVLMKLGLYDNGRAKERVFQHFFRGMSEAEFNDWCEWFAEAFAYILRPQGMEALRQALADDHQVVVASASIDRWVRPFFATLSPLTPHPSPLITVIGTEIEVREGRLTGRFATPNCYGEEKVHRLRQLFPELSPHQPEANLSPLTPHPSPLVIAYGDSRGDRELLQMADEAHYKPFR